MCLKCLNNFSSESSRNKTNRGKNRIDICPQTVFEVQPHNVLTYSIDVMKINTENSTQDNCPSLD